MRRPLPVTVLALAVLSLAGFNLWGRCVRTLQVQDQLLEYGLYGPLIAILATGALWAIGFGAAAIGLYRLRPWARRWTLVAIVLYQINVWLVRLAFEKSSMEPLTRPADAAVSLLSIGLVWAALFWPATRRAFATRGS